jgi:predicted DNA-binding transcriptional regulator YafY
VGKDSKLKDSILKKIYFKSEIAIHGNHILKAHLGKIVEKLSNSIKDEKRVILKDYHSANSQKISDRLVEPITFSDNYNSLIAFEVETGENKYFNIERITDVNVLDKNQEFQEKHRADKLDVFGFSELNGEKFDIELRLTLRAYLILKEEYPLVHPFVKKEPNKETYLLKCIVNNPKAITRFLLGLPKDVEVIGSEEFKKYLY